MLQAIPASNCIIGKEEKDAMHLAVDRGWLTEGPFVKAFEERLASQFSVKHAITCNSGSSANLLAVAALVEAGYWRAGDEILTVAASFPTTVNPLLLYGLVPVFVDIRLDTLNVDVSLLQKAITTKTKGIMLAHTLGNPFDVAEVLKLCRAFNFRLVEDCCDALGSTYNGQHVGRFGDIATCSFFPAHHITTGEGGAVMTNSDKLATLIRSVRDWGRDCYCLPGKENTCGKRFYQENSLPKGYDHKYTYSSLGFNLKITEIQAACGVAQFDRLPTFIQNRRSNFAYLAGQLDGLSALNITRATPSSDPSWFGFPITIKEKGIRSKLQEYLAERQIGSRLLFSGNITKQPYMKHRKFRVYGELTNTDKVMNDTLWIGVWPGLTEPMLEFVAQKIKEFFGDGF